MRITSRWRVATSGRRPEWVALLGARPRRALMNRGDWSEIARRAIVVELAATVCPDQHDLRPRDMIDLQLFLWVQDSAEYAE